MLEDNMLESVPFRFLDLPKELRFMVYESLAISTEQIRLLSFADGLHLDQQESTSCLNQPAITVALHTFPVQIFTTCRTIYSEALPFLSRKLDRVRESIPVISLDSDYLSTHGPDCAQTLLRSLLDQVNAHPCFQPKTETAIHRPKNDNSRPQYPDKVHHWLTQTTHLLLSQRPAPCPFSGFMSARTNPTTRLIIEMPKISRYTTYRDIAVGVPPHAGTPSMHTASVSTHLTELWQDLAGYTKGLKHVTSGAIVFGQEDVRVLRKEGLVVKKVVALDFGLRRVG